MAEYIDKEEAYHAVDKRIDELNRDKEFSIAKEICVSGVKKHITSISPSDVVERAKIDKAVEEIKAIRDNYEKINNPWGDSMDYANPYSKVLKILEEI